jgi:hypothetical protein
MLKYALCFLFAASCATAGTISGFEGLPVSIYVTGRGYIGSVVGGGSPLQTPPSIGNYTFTVTSDTISFTQPEGGYSSPGVYFTFYAPTLPTPITGVSIDPATNYEGFTSNRVEFDATHVYMILGGLDTSGPDAIVLDVAFGPSAAPEPPSSLLLFGALLVLIPGFWLRKVGNVR